MELQNTTRQLRSVFKYGRKYKSNQKSNKKKAPKIVIQNLEVMDTIELDYQLTSFLDDSNINEENSIERPNDSIRKNKINKGQIYVDDSFKSENRCDYINTDDEFKTAEKY